MWPALLLAPSEGTFAAYLAVSRPALVVLLLVPAVLFLLRERNEEATQSSSTESPTS